CFFFQAEDGIRDGHVTGVQTCALPICAPGSGWRGAAPGARAAWPDDIGPGRRQSRRRCESTLLRVSFENRRARTTSCRWPETCPDRKSTRLNSSHVAISYAVFCLKKKK